MSVHTETTARYLNNLRAVVEQASSMDVQDGMSWYDEAQTFSHTLANTLDPEVWGPVSERREIAAAVIAVLSPRLSWTKNKLYAARCFEYARQGIPELMLELPVFKANTTKAMMLLDPSNTVSTLDIVRGPKVTAFFQNIMGSQQHVTLDTHAINACRGEFAANPTLPKAPERAAMCEAYTLLSLDLNCTVAQAQAVVWVTWRHIKNPNHTLG